jgi:BlaI family transcriptional regulator, penicillinase repressor
MSRETVRLGRVQHRIMQFLWAKGHATAREITEELSRTSPIAHSTVQTLLRGLEAKGAVAHEEVSRVFVFRPLIAESEARESAARDILTRIFDGSVYGLVAHLLRSESVPPEELDRLRRLIDEESAK